MCVFRKYLLNFLFCISERGRHVVDLVELTVTYVKGYERRDGGCCGTHTPRRAHLAQREGLQKEVTFHVGSDG